MKIKNITRLTLLLLAAFSFSVMLSACDGGECYEKDFKTSLKAAPGSTPGTDLNDDCL